MCFAFAFAFVFVLRCLGDSSIHTGLKTTALIVKTNVVELYCQSLNSGSYILYELGEFTNFSLIFVFSAYNIGKITESFQKVLGSIQ